MSLTIQYGLPALLCPPPVVPGMPLDPNAVYPATPYTYEALAQSQTSGTSQALNRNSRRSEITAQYGAAGAFAVAYGLDLSESSPNTLVLNYSAGAAGVNGPQVKPTAGALALTDNAYSWLWITSAGTITAVSGADPTTVPAPPTSAAAFLGRVRTGAGAILEIEYSGRWLLRGGDLYRRTGDAGQPGDTPPASLLLWTRTAGGLYLWDGTAWTQQASAAAAATTDDLTTRVDELEGKLAWLTALVARHIPSQELLLDLDAYLPEEMERGMCELQ